MNAPQPANHFMPSLLRPDPGPGTDHWLPENGPASLAHIPGEDGLPILGNTLKLLTDPAAYTAAAAARHGPVFRSRAFGQTGVVMLGPDANERVLFDRDKIFSSEQGWGPILNLLFPRGLMLMDFDHHRVDRRTLSVAFKPEPMRGYADALNEGIARRVATWRGQTMPFYPAIKQLTLDLAASAFLGIPWGPEADRVNRAFVDMVQATVGIVRRPVPFTAMGRGVAGRAFLIEYFTPMVAERRASEGDDLFTHVCKATDEAGDHLTVPAIVDHMNFLMMAAHDTITSSLTTTIWQLAQHPEWQDRLYDEMTAIAPPGSGVGHNALGQLELTDMAFKEALRLIPPVPTVPRRALRDFSFGGFDIPAGTQVSISPLYTHHMADHWPDPERFDPLRFEAEPTRARHKYAWVPYGGGAHMCLGLHFATMQAKIFLHHVVTTLRVSVEPGYRPDWAMWPIPRPKDGLKVTFTAR